MWQAVWLLVLLQHTAPALTELCPAISPSESLLLVLLLLLLMVEGVVTH